MSLNANFLLHSKSHQHSYAEWLRPFIASGLNANGVMPPRYSAHVRDFFSLLQTDACASLLNLWRHADVSSMQNKALPEMHCARADDGRPMQAYVN
jgi:hypothetical protein